MSQPPRRSVLFAVLIAAVITLLVSLLRLYGELNNWPAILCGKDVGGDMSLISISFLVPIFGFWFGRRLAANGNRPAHAGKALLWCLLGIGVVFGIFALATKVLSDPAAQAWCFGLGTPLAGLTAFMAWRSSWLTCVSYGLLARIPVIVIQHEAIKRGWDTHYAKGAPNMAPDQVEFGLTLAQATFWPFAFTAIIGTMFAVLGAVTAKRPA